MPLLLALLPKILNTQPTKTRLPVKKALFYLIVSIIVIAALFFTLPFFDCLTIKFVFP